MNRYLKDAVFGAIGGVAGTFVIGKTVGALSKLLSEEDKELEMKLTPKPTAEALAERISPDRKATLGAVIHWSYGIFCGGLYGILRKQYPTISKAAGLPFGTAFAIFGVAPPLHQYPASIVARDLAAHYAYAATVEGTCRVLETVEHAVAAPPLRTNADLRRVS
jgi:hypothetical protein